MSAMERLEHADAIARLRGHDVSLFGGDAATAASVSTRLGWTDLAASAQTTLAVAAELAADARTDGVTDVVLLGMGGSSLASLVIGGFLGGDGPALHVLDTVSPITVRRTLDSARSCIHALPHREQVGWHDRAERALRGIPRSREPGARRTRGGPPLHRTHRSG